MPALVMNRHVPGQAVAHKFGPGPDPELGEDLAQVVVDRARTEVEPGGDVPVGQAFRD
jgi:hypothetical protein